MTFKPTIGAWCVAYGIGPYLWLETMSGRAKDARAKMGEIMRSTYPDTIETSADGWAHALGKGYRVVKVDIFPHGEQP